MMKKKMLTKMIVLALAIVVLVAAVALAGEDSPKARNTYWQLVGDVNSDAPLARVMNGQNVPLTELKAITAEDLMAFAAANRLPIDMARHGWYAAMADSLRGDPAQLPAESRTALAPFLSMPDTWRDGSANAERRTLRRGLTQADVQRIAEETGLPGGFVAWLMLEDEWHEGDWEDVNDWREGRQSWIFADHAYEKELREAYGKSAVVDDDEVERVLRQNGIWYDD